MGSVLVFLKEIMGSMSLIDFLCDSKVELKHLETFLRVEAVKVTLEYSLIYLPALPDHVVENLVENRLFASRNAVPG